MRWSDLFGRHRLALILGLVGLFGTAATAVAVPVELTLVFDGEGPDAPVAVRAMSDAENSSERREVEGRTTDTGDPLTLDLEPGRVWRVRATTPGWWSPEVVVTPTTPAASVRVPVFRTGTIRGSARTAPDKTPRRDLRVRFESPEEPAAEEGRLRVPRSTVHCPLEADGRWSCDVPAAKLDLRLSLPERVPVYLWGIEVQAGEARSLGELVFRTGASVAGWITAEEAGARTLGTAGARVTLRPAAPGDPSTPRAVAREKLAPLEQRTPVDERGFFQFHGVAAGEYEVIATADGFAATRFGPVPVIEGHETVLPEPLVLRPPAEVEIRLDPPVDPWGVAWRIRLTAIDTVEGAAPPVETEVGPAGHWRGTLPPGRYQLFVLDRRSDRRLTRTLDVPPEGFALDLAIAVVLVEGLVSLGDAPVPAILWFGGRHGAERVRLEADDEGRFLGVLPRAGTWRVHVQAGDGDLAQEIPPVEVETPSPGEAAVVEIRLPDTEVTGRVVDSSGRPVPGAEIEATP